MQQLWLVDWIYYVVFNKGRSAIQLLSFIEVDRSLYNGNRVVHGNPAMLKVLELVLDECCQKFKKPRRSESQIYVEFVHLSSRQFNSWIAASEVKTMNDFWELGILQQLKDNFSKQLEK